MAPMNQSPALPYEQYRQVRLPRPAKLHKGLDVVQIALDKSQKTLMSQPSQQGSLHRQ